MVSEQTKQVITLHSKRVKGSDWRKGQKTWGSKVGWTYILDPTNRTCLILCLGVCLGFFHCLVPWSSTIEGSYLPFMKIQLFSKSSCDIDLIHSNVWYAPLTSMNGHRYLLLSLMIPQGVYGYTSWNQKTKWYMCSKPFIMLSDVYPDPLWGSVEHRFLGIYHITPKIRIPRNLLIGRSMNADHGDNGHDPSDHVKRRSLWDYHSLWTLLETHNGFFLFILGLFGESIHV